VILLDRGDPPGPMKKPAEVITHRTKDGGGTEHQVTTFTYDPTGRPTQTLFPDGSTEVTTYELGQLKSYRTRRGQKKMVDQYDARGREKHHYWLTPQNAADTQTPAISQEWDAAGRMTRISNSFSIIDYNYDDAGQVRTEGTTVTESGGLSEVRYCRYPNGSVASHLSQRIDGGEPQLHSARAIGERGVGERSDELRLSAGREDRLSGPDQLRGHEI
jgi:YD repeat-containing protein